MAKMYIVKRAWRLFKPTYFCEFVDKFPIATRFKDRAMRFEAREMANHVATAAHNCYGGKWRVVPVNERQI